MQNDILKNNIAPWQEKGRWYHASIDAATKTIITDDTDSFLTNNVTVGSVYGSITFRIDNPKYQVVDYKYYPKNVVYSAAQAITTTRYYYPTGEVLYTTIANTATSGTVELWVFITKNV